MNELAKASEDLPCRSNEPETVPQLQAIFSPGWGSPLLSVSPSTRREDWGMGRPSRPASSAGGARKTPDLTDGVLVDTMELTIFIDTKDKRISLAGGSTASLSES